MGFGLPSLSAQYSSAKIQGDTDNRFKNFFSGNTRVGQKFADLDAVKKFVIVGVTILGAIFLIKRRTK